MRAILLTGLPALSLLLLPLSPGAADRCFEFGVRGYPDEKFRAVTGEAAVHRDVEAQLKLAEKDRRMFPSGPIDSGNGGVNQPWSWHFVAGKWGMAEMSIEVCDSWPGYIEKHRDAWIASPTNFCPWGGYVIRECPTVALRPGRAEAIPRARPLLRDGRILIGGTEVTPAGRVETP